MIELVSSKSYFDRPPKMKITKTTIVFLVVVACLTVVVCLPVVAQTIPNDLPEKTPATIIKQDGDRQTVVKKLKKPKPIPVLLPTRARVKLKDGHQRTGSVVSVNSQQIMIKRGEISKAEDINNIEQIKFDKSECCWWPNGIDIIVLRGVGVETIRKDRHFKVRANELVWENVEEKAIEIKPESVIQIDNRPIYTPNDIPRSMRNVQGHYVVSKMEHKEQVWIITAALSF
ncbi:hypothetical protein [Okeania sp. KiyG1]|uniref:hypothetical protein n=1 Tax=Okeania sp. KiyG1 TaxID=2720165 RepID=UPI0019B519FC|nr:hypothetical protein [Okeania sp. KiyG1]GGA00609.1 hypothetical protein CYANOKiyG1_12320 [Okeania sp. KiyG1]